MKARPAPPLLLFCALVLLVATGPAVAAVDPASGPPVGGMSAVGTSVGTTRSGVDYVRKNVDWTAFFRQLKATGRDLIGRYLPIQGAMQRCATTTELAAAAASGVDCFFWFETMDDLYRASRGYAAGAADANEALRALASLGVPTTTPVYYTVDWGLSDGSQIDAYFKGVASVVPVSQIGAYGNYTTIDWVCQHSLATYFCQSDFWMDGRGWHPQAQMRQQTATFSIGGVYVDRLTVTTAEFGQNHRYEQSDTRLLYSGTWSAGTTPAGSYSGGSYRYSSSAGASVTIAFNGTSLDWIAKKSPTPGTAAVSVDGAASVPVDLYWSSTLYKREVWGTDPQPDGLHTVKITTSTGTVNLDAFDISGSLATLTREEETSGALLYSGTWSRTQSSSASASYYNLSNAADASVTIHFTGQRLDVLATRGPVMGQADFSVDGGPVTTVDLHGAMPSYKQNVWTTPELPAGLHVVTIARNASAPAGRYINLDTLEIVGLAAVPPTVTSLVPAFGSTTGGKTAVINGTGFVGLRGPGAVTFGGADAGSYTVNSPTKITAIAPAQAAGVAQVQVTAAGGGTADTPADDYTYMPPVAYAFLRGAHRYQTAQLVSQAMCPGALPAGAGLVVAPGESFQEALCGSPLAAAYGGPVLLTPASLLENGTKAELQRLAPTYVFCIGLSSGVVDAVRAALPAATVTAINGVLGDVYDMSYKVAKALGDKVGDMSGTTAIVTIGANFPDAIGVLPLACAQLWPVLLTEYGDGRALGAAAATAMSELGITQALKAGTYATLPGGVTGLANLSGGDRYATDVHVADWATTHAGLSFTHVALVTGDKFPDALASGPYLARDHGILLLSPLYGPLPAIIGATLAANRTAVQNLTFIACIEPVIGQVKALLP